MGSDKHSKHRNDGSDDDDEDALENSGVVEEMSSDSSLSSDSSMDDTSSDEEEDGGTKKNQAQEEEEEVDEEDPVVKAITKAKEKKESNHPPDLVLAAIPSVLCFHPQEDRIVFGNYEGQLQLYSYSVTENKMLIECQHKDSSVRAITFSNDGEKLISCFSDQVLKVYDVQNDLKPERTIKNATSAAPSSLFVIDEHLFALGDDDGNVSLWDTRTNKNDPTTTVRLGEDAITSMVSNDDRRTLVCTSEEGAIYAVKIRQGKVLVASEIYDYEFNCSCVFKQESKLAVGDGKGDVYIFNWDEFGKHSDICTGVGRGEAVNAMIPITEKIILSGGDDGFIRAFHYFPQKYLGIVGKVGHPIEKMDVCNDGHLIASTGADETVKFWNVAYFETMTAQVAASTSKAAEKNKEEAGGGGAVGGTGKSKKGHTKASGQKQDLSRNNLPSSSHQNASDFFKGLAD